MKSNRLLIYLFICCAISFGTGCSKTNLPMNSTRSFYMGVTPWPADFTQTEVLGAYQFINQHCDIISQHFDDGIPWQEALQQQPMPTAFQQDVQNRIALTPPGKTILLSVSALNLTRKAKSDYYKHSSPNITDSIRQHWQQIRFSDPSVSNAYLHYISYLIDQFQPAYVNFGVESNLSVWPENDFNDYLIFIQQVYAALKIKYPQLPFFVSLMAEEGTSALNNAARLLPYSDYVALSAYPYITSGSSANGNTNPQLLPTDYFTRYINLAPNKPFAFAETGYNAEPLQIAAFQLNKQGNAAWQDAYLQQVLQLCQQQHAVFFIWFCYKDYNAGVQTLISMGQYQPLFSLWSDMGLVSESNQLRPAYQTWLNWMQMNREP
ncbi:MAG: hypothetical protein RLY16_187 [Bacteroidota bacterium]